MARQVRNGDGAHETNGIKYDSVVDRSRTVARFEGNLIPK